LIDVVEGNRTYVPCIYLLNKIDQISIEELGKTGLPIFKTDTEKNMLLIPLRKKRYIVYPFGHMLFSEDKK
jgi:ribosome-interacting GTPase 1